MFSVEGLINEYCEPAKILRDGKMVTIEPLTETESFHMEGFPELEAFHTSGGTSTLPETFQGQVGECFEKTLRYPGHVAMLRSLYDLGLFSSEKLHIDGMLVSPRQIMSKLVRSEVQRRRARSDAAPRGSTSGRRHCVVQHGRPYRRCHGTDFDDAHHRVAGVDRSADARRWPDRQARRRSPGDRCSRPTFPRRDGAARYHHRIPHRVSAGFAHRSCLRRYRRAS